MRFLATDNDITHPTSPLPGLGVGYRRRTGKGAADISINGIGHTLNKNPKIYWTIPRGSYIQYLTPNDKASSYLGGGLAWGGLDSRKQKFFGMITSATVGHEFLHNSEILSFAELSISQPALAFYQIGGFPGPTAELTFGLGF